MSSYTTIRVSKVTRDFLESKGSKGEDYEQILLKIIPGLKEYQERKKKESEKEDEN